MKEGILGTAVLGTLLLLVATLHQTMAYLDHKIWPGGEWSASKNIIYCLATVFYLAYAAKFFLKRKRALLAEGNPTPFLLFSKRIDAGRRH